MKKDKKNLGFTMIEMLATILVLLIVLLIATPSIRRMLNKTNDLSKEYVENLVIDAAKEYASVTNKTVTDTLKLVGDKNVIFLETLLNMGLIEQSDIDKLGAEARVLLTLKDNNYLEYKIVYDGSLAENTNGQIILLGGNPTYVRQNTPYMEPGYIALDSLGNIVNGEVEITGEVNTAILGVYEKTYKYTDEKNNVIEVKRTVIVYDSTYPKVTVATSISNNPYNNKYAKNGEVVTLNLTFSKTVTDPKVTIGGREAIVTGSGLTRIATLNIPSNENSLINRELAIKVSDYKDIYENEGEEKTNVTSGGLVVFDNVKPKVISSAMVSNHTSNKYAKNSHTITLTTTFTEPVINTTPKISGRTTTATLTNNTLTSTYSIPSAESTLVEGNLVGSIDTYMDRAGNIGESNDIKLSGGAVVYDRTAPTLPTFVSNYSVGGSSYNSSWTNKEVYSRITTTDLLSGALEIQYSKDKQSWTKFAFGKSNGLQTSGTSYYGEEVWSLINRDDTFYFRAIDKAGNISSLSNSYLVRYDISKPTYTSYTTTPSITSTVLSITGAADNYGISTYEYYLNGTRVASLTTPSYTYTGLTAATSYDFSFKILDQAGNEVGSNRAVATNPSVPISVSATQGTTAQGKQITVSWNANGNPGSVNYKIFGSTDNISFTELGTTMSTSYVDSGIALANNNGGSGVTKYYKVQAISSGGVVTNQTSSVSGTTLASPAATSNMDAPLNSGKNTIALSWSAVPGAKGYVLVLFDGYAYRYKDIGNVTSWNSDTAKVFPTSGQISAWNGTSDPFRWGGDGTTFPSNASVLYQKSSSSTYNNSHYYVWVHLYSYDTASRSSGGVWTGAKSLAGNNPDRDSPTCASSGGSSAWRNTNLTITGECDDKGGSGCVGNISHTYSTDINTTTAGAAGNNSGGTVKDNAGNTASCSANQTVRIDKTPPVIVEAYSGGMIFTDPNFSSGTNSFAIYNNTGNGNVKHTRIALSNPYGSYAMRITTSGVASPGHGGYVQSVTSRANAIYIHKIIAKIPVGYTIQRASNAVGTGSNVYWITSQAGTGSWQEYVYIQKAGSSGTFSTFGHVYLTGGAAPVTWDVAYSTIIDTGVKGTTGNIIFRATDSGSGYTHYGINTSSTTQPGYTAVTNSSDLGTVVPGYTSNGTYYIWTKDAVGNVSNKAVSMTAIDTTAPTCTATKSNTGTIDGVTVTVTGSDPESGIVSGTGTFTGVKSNQPYTVTNGVGLTGTCSVTVTPQTQYRTNTCSAYTSCKNSACGAASCPNSSCTCATYNSCVHSSCGVATYKSCPNSSCTCATYNSCPNATACGYNSCPTSGCGCSTYISYSCSTTTGSTCTASGSNGPSATYVTCQDGYQYRYRLYYKCGTSAWTNKYSNYVYASSTNAFNYCDSNATSISGCSSGTLNFSCSSQSSVTHKRITTCTSSTCSVYKSCPNSACGAASCVNSSCTCATYNSCRHSSCGVEAYKSCPNSSCTCATYNSCANATACGYNSCPTAACGCTTWGGWSGWTTTACTAATNVRQCESRVVYN